MCINKDVYLKTLAMLANKKHKTGQFSEHTLIKVACTYLTNSLSKT